MDIANTIMAIAAACGTLGSLGVVIFYAGRITRLVEDNTRATEKIADKLDAHVIENTANIHALDIRVTKLETK